MKYSLLLTPAHQLTPRLMPCHGNINHPARPWDESKLEINVLRGLAAARRGMLERGWGGGGSQMGKGAAAMGTAVHGHRDQTMPSHAGVLRKAGVQGRVLNHCTPESKFGVRAWEHRQAWPVPAEPQAGSISPAGPGGKALSLPGVLIKPLRRRPPPSPLATHTNYILYVFYLLCRF